MTDQSDKTQVNKPYSSEPEPSHPQPNPWLEAFQTLGLSIVLALGIRHFVAEARYIPSGSMKPTLQINDRLVVEKVSYYFNPPKRGEIVVFHPPDSPLLKGQEKEAFIKRIIGLPGETVEVKDGKVFVNGQALEEDYIMAPPEYAWGPQQVPDNAYLVLGDNRNSSFDSHAWGFVPHDHIIGKALVRFWPPSRLGWLDQQ